MIGHSLGRIDTSYFLTTFPASILFGACSPFSLAPTISLPHFRSYEVVLIHMCVLPYKYRTILEMLLTLKLLSK